MLGEPKIGRQDTWGIRTLLRSGCPPIVLSEECPGVMDFKVSLARQAPSGAMTCALAGKLSRVGNHVSCGLAV